MKKKNVGSIFVVIITVVICLLILIFRLVEVPEKKEYTGYMSSTVNALEEATRQEAISKNVLTIALAAFELTVGISLAYIIQKVGELSEGQEYFIKKMVNNSAEQVKNNPNYANHNDAKLQEHHTSMSSNPIKNTCPICFATIDGNEAFCPKCGAKIK